MSPLKHRKFLQQRLQILIFILLSCGIGSSKTIAQSSFIPFVLHIHASGGWDTTMVFENKIGKSGVSVETGATSATGAGNIAYVHNTNRPAVKTFFDTYGASAAIVNGINTGGINRLHALKTMMGAIPAGRFRYSDWISYYSFSTNPVMPLPHLVIDAPWMPGDYSSVATLLPSSMIDTFAEGLNGNLDNNAESALAAFRLHHLKKSLPGAIFAEIFIVMNPITDLLS